jgi:amino acid adenylation domain-containing protein
MGGSLGGSDGPGPPSVEPVVDSSRRFVEVLTMRPTMSSRQRARKDRSARPSPLIPGHGESPLICSTAGRAARHATSAQLVVHVSAVVPPSTAKGSSTSRLGAVDAARGTAMLLVFLAHFADAYLAPAGDRTLLFLARFTMLASPTFMVVSGMMLGLLHATQGERFPAIRDRLTGRALFLLLVGHPLVALAFLGVDADVRHLVLITDAIAVSLLVGTRLVTRMGARQRLLLGALLFMASWVAALASHPPVGSTLHVLQATFLGTREPLPRTWNFPLVPWLGVYLAGSALGQRLGESVRAGDRAGGMALVRRVGAWCLAAGLLGAALRTLLRVTQLGDSTAWLGGAVALTTPWQKYPPGPTYLLFYAGCGLLLLVGLDAAEARGLLGRYRAWAERMGRHSLFTFLLQFVLYFGLLAPLGLPFTRAWPLLFVATVLVIGTAVAAWERSGYGRWLTVGRVPPLPATATGATPVTATVAPAAPAGRSGLPDPRAPLPGAWVAPVHALVWRQAARTPDALAVRDAAGDWTYAQVERSARALAAALADAGVARGDVVAVFATRGAALVPTVLGILECGAGFALLDPAHPAQRLAGCVELIRPRAFVSLAAAGSAEPLRPALDRAGCTLWVEAPATPGAWTTGPLGRAARPGPATAGLAAAGLAASDLAYVAFTSGTTGRPKAIAGPHGPLPHFVLWQAATFDLGPADRFAMLSGLGHDPLLRDLFTPLVSGSSLHVPEELRAPEQLRDWLRREGVTVIHLTPSLAQLLLHAADPGEALPALRHAFFGGEPLHPALVERFRRLAPAARLVGFYGATETPQAMGFHVVEDGPVTGRVLPIGVGIEGVQLLVLAEGGRLAAPGEVGELHVRTPYLSLGYLHDEALTRSRFIANPFTADPADRLYRSGDLARYREDGLVELMGRSDDQVKIRGFRVELGEIEAALLEDPAVSQAAVLLVGEDDAARRLTAFVAGRGSRPEALRARLAERLPEYMVPKEWVLLESLPLTPNGKVDRAALPRQAGARGALTGDTVAPRDELERRLAGIWQEILRLPAIGVEDDFGLLGGDSLNALEILVRVEEEFGPRLPMRAFLVAGTVAAMARLIREGAGLHGSLVVPLQPHGTRRPLFWLPGGGGLSVMAFRRVSLALGADQPVYGLEAEVDAELAPTDLPGIARRYLEEIRAVQPVGPYQLLGFSLGSFVAYEMAVQLRAQGEAVALLILFDTAPGWRAPLGERLLVVAQRLRHLARRLRGQPPSAWARFAWSLLSSRVGALRDRLRPSPPPAGPEDTAGAFTEAIRRNTAALAAYSSRPLPPYDGRVTAVLVRDSSFDGVRPELDPRLAWRHTARGGVEAIRVPGNHLSVLEPPHVAALAEAIRGCVARAEGAFHA